MFTGKLGKLFITVVIVSSTTISVALDWDSTHLFNPEWPGHAVFHGLLFLNLLVGVSVVSLWLMWRKSKEPELGVRIAVILLLVYRTSFFYLGLLIQEAAALPGNEEPPYLAGIPIYANVVASGIFIVLILFGYWLYRRELLSVRE